MPNSKKFSPLKRCKFIEDKFSPLKRCKFIENDNKKIVEDALLMEDDESSMKRDDESDFEGNELNPDPRQLKGKHLDVISFLSNNGETSYLVGSNGHFVGLDVVRGKHLVICCVSLPMAGDLSGDYWRAMIDAYPELSQAGFEMVVAANVKPNIKATFDHFFSALPCLAIPFSDLETRNSICSYIGLSLNCFYKNVSAIVVDPTGNILHYRGTPELFYTYGFEWFARNKEAIDTQDHVLRIRLDPFYKNTCVSLPKDINDALLGEPLSLHEDILLCEPSLMLSTLDTPGRSLSVSELSKKYVGLYLCLNMHFISDLHNIHQQCIANNKELEIILVCLPFFEQPKLYYEELIEFLECNNTKSWFIFPYDGKVCRRLWRVFGREWEVDRLMILPPNCKSGELEGRTIVNQLKIEAYPFTRSTIVEQKFSALKSLTPASLFKGTREAHTCLVRNGSKCNVPQSAIKGKKLLLYLDGLQFQYDHGKLCRLLKKHYPKIQAMGCEVVFVPLDSKDSRPRHVKLAKMPWLIMPVKAAVEASVVDQLTFQYDSDKDRHNQLIVVGEDGEILSTQVKKRLKKYGVSDSLFRDTLRKEIIAELDLLEYEDDER